MNPSEEVGRKTVRIFPDYAGTVVWFGGPVGYDLTGLTPALVRDLRDWEQFYYDSLRPDLDWKSADLAREFTAEGNRLAQRLADEIGDGYEVEFTSYEERAPARRFRGTAASNVGAVAAFNALAAALSAEREEVSRARAADETGENTGVNTGWLASSPVAGSVFKPPEPGIGGGELPEQ